MIIFIKRQGGAYLACVCLALSLEVVTGILATTDKPMETLLELAASFTWLFLIPPLGLYWLLTAPYPPYPINDHISWITLIPISIVYYGLLASPVLLWGYLKRVFPSDWMRNILLTVITTAAWMIIHALLFFHAWRVIDYP